MDLYPCTASTIGQEFTAYTFFWGSNSVNQCQGFLGTVFGLGTALTSADVTTCTTDGCNAPPGVKTTAVASAAVANLAANPPPGTTVQTALQAMTPSPPPPVRFERRPRCCCALS